MTPADTSLLKDPMSSRATARQRTALSRISPGWEPDGDHTVDLSDDAEATAELAATGGDIREVGARAGEPGAGRPRDPAGGKSGHPRTALAFTAIGLAVLVAAGAGAVAARRGPGTTTAARWSRAEPSATTRAATAAQPPPSPTVSAVALPATYTVPGTPPSLPWPASGQSSLRVVGVGRMGSTSGQRPVPIASVTKVMTAYLVLRDHPLGTNASGPTLTVTDAEAAAYPEQVAKDESLVKVTAGEVLTERQALDALMLPSADNMALILARWDAGSVDAFLSKMNRAAASLGMTDTRYTDPSGLASSTVSTADDQTVLAARAMAIPAFARIVAQRSARIPVAGTVRNYNTLLGSSGVDGIKTGSTSAAGGCLLFSARYRVGGKSLTIVGAVFGQHGTTLYGLSLALDRSLALVRAAENALGSYPVVASGQTVATVGGVSLAPTKTLTVTGWPGLQFHTHLKPTDDLRPGAAAGSLEVDGPESHQSVPLAAH